MRWASSLVIQESCGGADRFRFQFIIADYKCTVHGYSYYKKGCRSVALWWHLCSGCFKSGVGQKNILCWFYLRQSCIAMREMKIYCYGYVRRVIHRLKPSDERFNVHSKFYPKTFDELKFEPVGTKLWEWRAAQWSEDAFASSRLLRCPPLPKTL